MIFFYPIFYAKILIFPYAVTPFDIVSKFPNLWCYIKLLYCISYFFNLLLAVNAVFKYIILKRDIFRKPTNHTFLTNTGNFNLLIGRNSQTQLDVCIPEKGLYQNILITGTIGSRKNKFCYVSIL